MRHRILFVSHTAEPCGPTASLSLLLDALRERFDIAVAVPEDGPFSAELKRVGTKCHAVGPLTKTSVPRLVRLIRRTRASLVYGNNTSRGSENALIAARIARIPFICHVRGMGNGRGWRRLAFLRFADAAIAVSRACADSVDRFTGRRPLHVVHNGVAQTAWCHDRVVARARLAAELDMATDAPIVLGLAHLNPRKGQHHAVRAWPSVLEAIPAARLLLAGAHDRDPTYVARLQSTIRAAGLEDRVRLLGLRNDVDCLTAAADVFMHTAIADPHPRAVIEAMAAGLPVVAFDVDGVAETVVDDRTGKLVPTGDEAGLADAISMLLGDPDRRAAMGAASRRRAAERFSARETARRVGDIIEDVLRDRAGSASRVGRGLHADSRNAYHA